MYWFLSETLIWQVSSENFFSTAYFKDNRRMIRKSKISKVDGIISPSCLIMEVKDLKNIKCLNLRSQK